MKLDVPFADLVRDVNVLAGLTAHYHVCEEVREATGIDVRAERFAADYTDAIDWTLSKTAMTRDAFDALTLVEQANAFTVARITDEVVIGRIQKAVGKAVAEGLDMETFRQRVDGIVSSAGLDTLNPWHLETIFRTNVQDAYGAGRWEAFNAPGVDEHILGYEYVTAGDDRVRETHQQMDGNVYTKNDPVWSIWWPPNGFMCRCQVLPVFAGERMTLSEPPMYKPDLGFERNPAWKTAA